MSHTGHTTQPTHPPGHGGEGSDTSHDMSGMNMYFHGGSQETILFKFWETENTGAFIGSLIGIFLIAVLYEALKFYREVLYEKNVSALDDQSSRGLLGGIKGTIFKRYHWVQTLLHMVQLVLSYFLMLIFMTYNIWLAVAITLGAGVGYLFFGWNKRSAFDVNEHCH